MEAMRKRRIYLVVLLAVAVVVLLIASGAFREREPEYGGEEVE